jgi:hypothetical protein
VEEMWALAGSVEEHMVEMEESALEANQESVEAISVAAATGSEGNKTIRLWASIHCQQVLVLVDSGSTASFMDSNLSRVMTEVRPLQHPLQVKVADGRKLWSTHMVPKCQWLCEGTNFVTDFKILPLSGYDLIVGMDWLEQHSPMAIHWGHKWLSFVYKGKYIKLQGVKPKTQSCPLISGTQFESLVRQEAIEQLLELHTEFQCGRVETPAVITELVNKFSLLFEEPKGLPPKRWIDHAIPLLPGVQPFRLRPYRYTPQQKDEIEKQVTKMLNSGIIQHSSSPFASPILLVKKKDGEWRLCVDYRRLNAYTVKNRYPMPIFDEITDELSGAAVFSKLDHRSGYHQIRLKEGYEHKTAFQTHYGHFEYRVMPFGLTGAPTTFQEFMNHILAPVLRKCVVVFLDDVLV